METNGKGLDSEDKFWERCHPLEIDVVLQNLFKYCPFKDLQEYRIVSKCWYEASFPYWLQRAPRIDINLDSDGGFFAWMTHLSLFLKTTRNDCHSYAPYEYSGLRQYRRFRVLQFDRCRNQELFPLFLRNCGQWITDLELSLYIPGVEMYHAAMLSTETPSLIKLKGIFTVKDNIRFSDEDFQPLATTHNKLKSLKLSHYYHDGLKWLSKAGWTQIFKRYPNLETIVLGEQVTCTDGTESIMEALYQVRSTESTMLNLNRLETYNEESPNLLISIQRLFRGKAPLTLQTFGIFIPPDTQNQTLYDVLNLQSSTLKKLTLHSENDIAYSLDQPFLMDSLRKLDLQGHVFQDFSFLKCFPNLATLSMAPSWYFSLPLPYMNSDQMEKDLEGVVISSLVKFKYHSIFSYDHPHNAEGYFGEQHIRTLARVMPNLKDITMCLTNETLREICRGWPHLERLCIYGDFVDDGGITGIVSGQEERIPENITSLKCLESFIVEILYVNSARVNITEASFENGFLMLSNLKKLDITVNGEFRDTVLEAAQQRIPNVRITNVKDMDVETEDPCHCCS